MVQKMKKQESFGIVAGGFNEASQFARNQERVYLRKRKGFIKYALQYGYKVCQPVCTYAYTNAEMGIPGYLGKRCVAAYFDS